MTVTGTSPISSENRNRLFKLALLASAATALQGCVAAVVPLAAGGLLGGAAPAYDPDKEAVQRPAIAEGTVEVETAVPQAAAPQAALAEAPAPTTSASDPLQAGLAEEALAQASPAQPAAPSPAVEEEPVAVAQVEPADPPIGTIEPEAAFVNADEPSITGGSLSATAAERELAPTPPITPPAEALAEAPGPTDVSGSETVIVPVPEEVEPPVTLVTPAPTPSAPGLEDAPTEVIAEPSPDPVRVIAVEPEATFASTSVDASTVSAADAAAALTTLAEPNEPQVDSATLARSAPAEPAVSATPAPTISNPAPVEQVAEAMPEPAPVVAAVPPPTPPAPISEGPTVRTLASGQFGALINYANRQQATAAEDRRSAILADRASLLPRRAECGATEPTVLIDLDPDGETFDPTNAFTAAPGLSSALAQIRASGVKVSWISRNSRGAIQSIRTALDRSGLDISGRDEVLLMRYPEDRKQTRREDLAQTACLIAIAGDARTDFDELFEYLINPEAAATLDPLMENGWFLIPSPLRPMDAPPIADTEESPAP